MAILNLYFARIGFDRLKPHLTDGVCRYVEQLLGLMGLDGKVLVATILKEMFPLAKLASANTQLNRLRQQVNETATAHAIPLQLEITLSKRGGADNRWVWFEGGVVGPEPAFTAELNDIAEDQLVENQRGVLVDECPIVALITFNEYETQGVRKYFCSDATLPPVTRNDITYNQLGKHGGVYVVHRVSRQGESEAQCSVHDVIAAWNPCAVIAVGIAFGMNPAKQEIGDVLVSDCIRDYELGRVNADGTITPRGDRPPASHVLINRFNTLKHNRSGDSAALTTWPTMHIGTMLSGNKLIDNLDYRQSLLELEQEAIGGEMEAMGVQRAAQRHKVDWIIVKAISDWGDGKKNTQNKEYYQKLAGEHAAMVVKAALDMGNLYTGDRQRINKKRFFGPPSALEMALRDCDDIPEGHWLGKTAGLPVSLHKDRDFVGNRNLHDARRSFEVIPYLLDWIDADVAPTLFALLGEYGMGKTVTCQKLCTILDERRQQDVTRPVPLYFDLRNVTGLDRRVPTLQEILEECMQRGWRTPHTPGAYTLDNVLNWMAQGAVVIIDGLDEVLVNLKESDGQVFTNTLLRLVTDVRQRPEMRSKLRMLLTCRTQFFRTLRDQKTHFTGQERGEYGPDAYRSMVLLPLSQDQVFRYLQSAASGGVDPERMLDTIRSVHNLEELTQRPYTLKLVAEFVPEIERDRMAGRTVYGVTLYRRMAKRWLERDHGKHHILPDHKMQLAAHLAAHLWRSNSGSLPITNIENWFHAWLDGQPDIKRRYSSLHPDQLEEDLRTATFLVRQEKGDTSAFRFAHTSLQEFFLADYLLHAVRENAPGNWAMQVPSVETLDFLGQMFAESQDMNLLQTLQQWRHEYRKHVSELLLAYALAAKRKKWPAPLLQGMNLRGATLRGWNINALDFDNRAWSDELGESNQWLDMSGVDFTGADLREVQLSRVRLTHAKFDNARLDNAMLLHCQVDHACFDGAMLTATIFRYCTLNGVSWVQSEGYRTQYIYCDPAPSLQDARFDAVLIAPHRIAESTTNKSTHTQSLPQAHLCWLTFQRGWINSCTWSSDGMRFLSADHDGTLLIWDARTGELMHTLTGHIGGVASCAWSSDGTRLLSAGHDGTLRVWDATTGELLYTRTGHTGQVNYCAWSNDGMRFISADHDGTLLVWDATTGELLHTLTGHEKEVTSCAWSSDGTRFLSASRDGTLRVWDAKTGELLHTLTVHEWEVTSCDLPEFLCSDSAKASHSGWVDYCAWSSDDTRLLSAGLDGTLRVWDATTGEQLHMLTGHVAEGAFCAWSSDGTRLLSAGRDNTLRVWDAATGELLHTLTGHEKEVTSCAWSSDGTRLLSAGRDNTLRVWDAATGELLHTLTGHVEGGTSCAWSSDGTRLLSAGNDSTLRVWDATTGELLHTLTGHVGGVTSCAWSSDGTWLLSAGNDSTLRVWDAKTGELLHTLTGHVGVVTSCAWSNDDTRLLSAGLDGTLRVWDATTGELLHTLAGHEQMRRAVISCAWSSDGTRLLSAGYALRVWDATTGELLHTLFYNGSEMVTFCAWSSDGTRLLSAGLDDKLHVWDATTRELLHTLTGHVGVVTSCAWSSDDTRLLSASHDGTLRVWDATTGELLHTFTGHVGGVTSCAWSSDDTRLLSAGNDSTLRIWDATTGELLRVHATSKCGHAVWLPKEDSVVQANGDAWRWLAWQMPGEDGFMTRLPLETFDL